MTAPLISICIPAFETETYLEQCLHSAFAQNFDSFEILVVSDASSGRDEKGRSAKKIVRTADKEGKKFRKKKSLANVELRFIEHSENRGILEVRRTLTYEARGEFIFFLDSDDELIPDALSTLWGAEVQQAYDIVHGNFVSGWYNEDGSFIASECTKCGAIFYGEVKEHDIFHKWISGEISGNVCGKLIRRNLLVFAFDNIPYTECNMADDFLIFFFVSQLARTYLGVEEKIYRYRISSGMSSARKIDSLRKWQLVCSAASVFTIISQITYGNEISSQHLNDAITDEEIILLRKQAGLYLKTSLAQMEQTVIPELKEQALEMLCDYWGKEAVEKVLQTS